MAKTPRGKQHETQGAKDVLRVLRKAGVSRSTLAKDAARQTPKKGKSNG